MFKWGCVHEEDNRNFSGQFYVSNLVINDMCNEVQWIFFPNNNSQLQTLFECCFIGVKHNRLLCTIWGILHIINTQKAFECTVWPFLIFPTPQMSNCVNQRMEFRVFERLMDRDYSSRVMAVRWAPSLKISPFLSPPGNFSYLWPNCRFAKPLLRCTFLTNPHPSDPNISSLTDSHCDWSECVLDLIWCWNAWGKEHQYSDN